MSDHQEGRIISNRAQERAAARVRAQESMKADLDKVREVEQRTKVAHETTTLVENEAIVDQSRHPNPTSRRARNAAAKERARLSMVPDWQMVRDRRLENGLPIIEMDAIDEEEEVVAIPIPEFGVMRTQVQVTFVDHRHKAMADVGPTELFSPIVKKATTVVKPSPNLLSWALLWLLLIILGFVGITLLLSFYHVRDICEVGGWNEVSLSGTTLSLTRKTNDSMRLILARSSDEHKMPLCSLGCYVNEFLKSGLSWCGARIARIAWVSMCVYPRLTSSLIGISLLPTLAANLGLF